MEICFEGIGQVVATFHTEAKLTPGMAVTMTKSGTVGLGNGSEPLCGVTVGAARGGAVAVQIGGVVKVGYSGSDLPTAGYCKLACDDKGRVAKQQSGGDGVNCLVLAVDADEDEKTVVIKL